MGYKVDSIKIYKEDTFNTQPASPKVFAMKNTSFDLNEEQRSETKKFLGNGHEPSHATYGGFDYNGSLGFVMGGDYMPILCEGVLGKGTVVDATADVWAATTAYAVGDIVNHSDTTHSLVCYKAGTSDANEPDLTGKEDGDTIVDGNITWVIRPTLKKINGKLDACLASFGVERKDIASCTAESDHYELFSGITMSSLDFKKEGGEITFEMSESLKGLGSTNSIKDPSYTQLGNGTALKENFYSEDDLVVEISDDGTVWTAIDVLDSLSLTVTRPSDIKDTMSGKRVAFGVVEITGTATGLFGSTLYEMSMAKQEKQVRFTYSKANGDKSIVTFSSIKFGNSKKGMSTDDDTTLEITLSGAGTMSESAVSYELISSVVL